MKIGFIGLGLMGRPMAGRLLDHGHELAVHTRRRETAQELLAAGGQWADSPLACAERSDVVITMLPDPPALDAVLDGPNGLLRSPAGRLVVDMSTVGPAAALRAASRLAEAGIGFADAPVSGGTPGAAAGTLSIMVGADDQTYETLRPVLERLGTPVHLGPVGSGQRAKLINQVVIGGVMGGIAEAFALCRKAGIEAALVGEVLRGGMAGGRLLEWAWPRLSEGDLAPGFKIEHLVKDLKLALAMAGDEDLDLTMTDAVLAAYDRAAAVASPAAGTQALVAAVLPDEARERT